MAQAMPFIAAGASIAQGISSKRAADNAAAAAAQAGEFNATIIERDIGLLERQKQLVNANFLTQMVRAASAFTGVQGSVKAGFGYGGIDISEGTAMTVLRQNAREFEYENKVAETNNAVSMMQIADAQEEARLNAQLSRMEGGASAAALRAQGTSSLISGIAGSARTAYEYKMFG